MVNAPVLITGGAGFIGSNLVDGLLDKGYAVRILDDLSTGKRSNLPLDNPNVELIVGNVADGQARDGRLQCSRSLGGRGVGSSLGR